MQPDAMIDAAHLRAALDHGGRDHLVVDVRTPGEYRAGHIPGAINLPLDQVDAHLRRIVNDAGGDMVLVCQSGSRARQAYETLTSAGLDGVEVLQGGMNGWTAVGAPTARDDDRANWTIERQVRLVAGSIVLASVLVSLARPRARFVAGAIGAGLTYAGLTDTCTMGRVLARMPWNAPPRADIDAALARMAD